MTARRIFIFGGAESGKSDLAEGVVATMRPASGRLPIYIATGQAFDAEMTAKIAAHKAARGPDWRTVEAPLDLTDALAQCDGDDLVLLDCVTLWLSNHLLADSDLDRETAGFLNALDVCPAAIVTVSNEVGQGVVPDNALARRFRIAQGQLNRQLAQRSDLVVAVMAGVPLVLKGTLPEGAG